MSVRKIFLVLVAAAFIFTWVHNTDQSQRTTHYTPTYEVIPHDPCYGEQDLPMDRWTC